MMHGRLELPTYRSVTGVWCGSWLAWSLMVALAAAQSPPVHYFQDARTAPGIVGAGQLWRGGTVAAHVFQPIRVTAPGGAVISIAENGQFGEASTGELHAALLVGHAYRLKVSNIPNFEDFEIFPSIELVSHLRPPQGQQFRFPVPIDLTQEELEMALNGRLVTRVIYLEDPRLALPSQEGPKDQRVYEVPPDENLLQAADRLGRPIAILRMGSRVPDLDAVTGRFLFDSPPVMRYEPPKEAPARPDDGSRGLEQGLERQDIPRLPASPALPSPQSQLRYRYE